MFWKLPARKVTVQLSTPYTDPGQYTVSQMDGQTDKNMMPIAFLF